MKCAECEYHKIVNGWRYRCIANPEKVTRISAKDAQKDVPCYKQKGVKPYVSRYNS